MKAACVMLLFVIADASFLYNRFLRCSMLHIVV